MNNMHVDTNVLYALAKQIKDIKRDQVETVLNTYLISKQNRQPKPELDQVLGRQPVIFSAIRPSHVVKQEDKLDEINQKSQPPKPK